MSGNAVFVAGIGMTPFGRQPDQSVKELTRSAVTAALVETTQVENPGFCEYGEGGPIAERGDTRIGGRIPVNPSGGLESKGHPIGATGLGQIHELVTQFGGEAGPRPVDGARLGMHIIENEHINATTIDIDAGTRMTAR